MTRRAAEVLSIMWATGEELVYERGQGFVGTTRVGRGIVFQLIRGCAITLDEDCEVGGFERYTINSTGKRLLKHYWGV